MQNWSRVLPFNLLDCACRVDDVSVLTIVCPWILLLQQDRLICFDQVLVADQLTFLFFCCRMRVSHMGVFHMSVFHLFWCNVPVHVAQKPARKGTQVFTNIWSVQIDIISHSLRRASSQNGTSHEGHEESTRCHWFDCQSCIHEGCRQSKGSGPRTPCSK